jgi:hypothetical protein
MSQLNTQKLDTLPDAIYFDLLSTNFKSTDTAPAIFTFNDSRSNPFIQSPEKYDLSILRFNMDTGTLPLFIPSIEPDQADPDLTIYSITLQGTDGVEGSETDLTPIRKFIKWSPQDESASTPLAPSDLPSKVQDNTTGYYNCYSYNYFLFLVYQALREALTDVVADYTAESVALPVPETDIYPPLLVWNANEKTATLKAQQKAYEVRVPNRIKIFMNAPLFNLFNSFPALYKGYGTPQSSLGRNFQLSIVDIGGSNTSSVFPSGIGTNEGTYTAVEMYQEYSTISEWSPISAIVFTSNTLPIEATQVSNPFSFVNGVPIQTGTNANEQRIITDIVSDSGLYRPSLTYVPSAEFRKVHLYGNSPLHNIDISIYYRLRNGELIPFRLSSGGSVSMKIGFLKK